MSDAIEVFYYIFTKIYNFLFNEAVIQPGVSIGWIFVTVVIFGLIIGNILNMPSGLHYGDHSGKKFLFRGWYKGYR